MFSVRKHQNDGTEWFNSGDSIDYKISSSVKMTNGCDKPVYCLSFKITLMHPSDKIFFAPTIPYTYSTLINHIEKIKQIQNELDYQHWVVEIKTLCKTLGGVDVPLLKITNFLEDSMSPHHNSSY